MQKIGALEIFSQHLNSINKLTMNFQLILESIKNLSADDIASFPNYFLSLDTHNTQLKRIFRGLKVTLANSFLTLLLGRPPTINELMEVTGESYFKIYRFLKDTDSARAVCLPYHILRRRSSEIRGLQRATTKRFVWKGPGINDTPGSGRPNIFPVFRASPLIDTFLLTREERYKLLSYLVSPPYVDAVKRLMIEILKFLLEVLNTDFMKACVKIFSNSLLAMWERADNLAKKKKLVQAKEFEKLPLDEWMASLHTEEFRHGLHELIREIEKMPEEAFASNCIIPAFVKGLDLKGYVSAAVNDKAVLRCTRCLCRSPIRISSEVVTCAFCGESYLSEMTEK